MTYEEAQRKAEEMSAVYAAALERVNQRIVTAEKFGDSNMAELRRERTRLRGLLGGVPLPEDIAYLVGWQRKENAPKSEAFAKLVADNKSSDPRPTKKQWEAHIRASRPVNHLRRSALVVGAAVVVAFVLRRTQ